MVTGTFLIVMCNVEEGKEKSSLADLNGMWRLIYSSAFARGGLPSLPGYKLGQVNPLMQNF